MKNADDLMLADVLNISVKRIENEFNNQWLIIDSAKEGGASSGEETSLQPDTCRFVFPPRTHDFTEICMCVKGVFTLKMGECIHKMEEGRVGLILPGLIHSEISMGKQDYTAMWLVINTSKVRLHLSGNDGGDFFTSDLFLLKRIDEYNVLLNMIKNEDKTREEHYYEMVKACLFQMYIIAAREVRFGEFAGTGYSSWKEHVVYEIKKFIEETGQARVKLRDISREVCMSENHINNIFKSVTGIPIKQYMEKKRICRAKQLLGNPSLTINSIAIQLGYYDRYHFGKAFKKATGFSPAQYRKMRRDEPNNKPIM